MKQKIVFFCYRKTYQNYQYSRDVKIDLFFQFIACVYIGNMQYYRHYVCMCAVDVSHRYPSLTHKFHHNFNWINLTHSAFAIKV